MKLVRHGAAGAERPGLVSADGSLLDLGGVIPDVAGEALSPASLERLRALDIAKLPRVPAGRRLGPCVGQVGKFIAIGLNYADHAAETGAKIPSEPIVFMKATSCIVGPNDDIWAMNEKSGEVVGRYKTDLLQHIPTNTMDEFIYVANSAGYVYCLRESRKDY